MLFSATEFQTGRVQIGGRAHQQYDVTPDDQSFMMIRAAGDLGTASRLILVQNFFEELKERVPN